MWADGQIMYMTLGKTHYYGQRMTTDGAQSGSITASIQGIFITFASLR